MGLVQGWGGGECDGMGIRLIWLSIPSHAYFTCCEAIAEVGHLELIFTSCPYSSFLKKNSWSRAKTNSKGVPRQT